MKKSKGKGYWLASVTVAVIGIFFIIKFHPTGFYYAYGLLFSFWIVAYIIGRLKRRKEIDK